MKSALTQQRCLNHSEREAAARCPECSHYYCRECATEHDGRVICASCLKKLAEEKKTQLAPMASLGRLAGGMTGFLLVWLLFYMIGLGLAGLPSEFHDGTVWKPAYGLAE